MRDDPGPTYDSEAAAGSDLSLIGVLVRRGDTRSATLNKTCRVQLTGRTQPKAEIEVFTLVGAGDIASCGDLLGAEATAALIEEIPGTVFAAGDLVYDRGTIGEFQNCYEPTWGKFKNRTMPAPGNHEYNGSSASGYFQYWGERAGEPSKGYYSYDLGGWHVVVLNTNCSVRALGGCAEGSPQEALAARGFSKALGRMYHRLRTPFSFQ